MVGTPGNRASSALRSSAERLPCNSDGGVILQRFPTGDADINFDTIAGVGDLGVESGSSGLGLTHAWVVVYHAEDAVAPLLHVVVRADAAEDGRAAQVRPRLVAQVSAKQKPQL